MFLEAGHGGVSFSACVFSDISLEMVRNMTNRVHVTFGRFCVFGCEDEDWMDWSIVMRTSVASMTEPSAQLITQQSGEAMIGPTGMRANWRMYAVVAAVKGAALAVFAHERLKSRLQFH